MYMNCLKIIGLQHPRKAHLSVFLWSGFKIYQAWLWKGKPAPASRCCVKAHLLGKTMQCFVRVSFWSSKQAFTAGQEYEEFGQVSDVPFWAATDLQTPHTQLPLEPITAPQPEADLGSSSSFEEGNARWLAGKKGGDGAGVHLPRSKACLQEPLCTRKSSAPVEDKYLLQLTDIFA